MNRYPAQITRVVDGDTFDAVVILHFHVQLTLRFRMLGINAPEMKETTKAAGLVSKEWLRQQIEGKAVELECHLREDKYGRWLCRVWVGSRNINQEMIDLQLAIPYMVDRS